MNRDSLGGVPVEGSRVPLNPAYDLNKQKRLQATLCALGLLAALNQVIISAVYHPGQSREWCWAAVGVSGAALVATLFGLAGVAAEARGLFLAYLVFLMALFMPFRVLYMGFGFDLQERRSALWYADILTSGIVVLLSWIQAYTGTFILSLFKVKSAFDKFSDREGTFGGGDLGAAKVVPTEELVNVCESLGLHPTMGQVVEMLSVLPEHAIFFRYYRNP
mmetsp:Transcript_23094/g.71929  ORF Transcript_23094/g.71929 Transcript_23094/m.71929 type:complete len:220 (-) Transcript_23094:63-722(-)